jgi:hypothetical protein
VLLLENLRDRIGLLSFKIKFNYGDIDSIMLKTDERIC